MQTTTCPECVVLCGALLLVAVDSRSSAVASIRVIQDDSLVDELAGEITHPEEDFAISAEIVADAVNAWRAEEGSLEGFTFSRPRGPVNRHLVFSVVPSERLNGVS